METMKAILTRQSVRSYKNEQISEDNLKILLKAACAAPTANGKFTEIHLTVIQDPKLLSRITAQTAIISGNPESRPFYGAPTVILVSCLPRKNIIYANAACMIENMAIAAADLGLGSVYLWGFIDALNLNSSLVAELDLPEGFLPVSALAVGYAIEEIVERELSADKIGINYLL